MPDENRAPYDIAVLADEAGYASVRMDLTRDEVALLERIGERIANTSLSTPRLTVEPAAKVSDFPEALATWRGATRRANFATRSTSHRTSQPATTARSPSTAGAGRSGSKTTRRPSWK